MVASLCVMTSCDDEKDDKKNSKGIKGTENGYAWVDLGLPSGLKWATCNVGAANPWDYGDYFAWGETNPKSSYEYSNYLDGRCTGYYDLGTDIDLLNGLTDITGTQYDAARANMGGGWRMPTATEQMELVSNCYWEWTENYNGRCVAGFIVYKVKDVADKGTAKLPHYSGAYYIYGIDKYGDIEDDEDYIRTLVSSYSLTDTHIFIPAAGCRSGSKWFGDEGYYWSSSLSKYEDVFDLAHYLLLDSDEVYWDTDDLGPWDRTDGFSVRGVCR